MKNFVIERIVRLSLYEEFCYCTDRQCSHSSKPHCYEFSTKFINEIFIANDVGEVPRHSHFS